VGYQLRALRLRANLDQRTLVEQAGIGMTVLKNPESGKGATVKTLIKMLARSILPPGLPRVRFSPRPSCCPP